MQTEKYQPKSDKLSKYNCGFSFISIQASLVYPQKVLNLHKLNRSSDLNLKPPGPFDPAWRFLPRGESPGVKRHSPNGQTPTTKENRDMISYVVNTPMKGS